ncbi:hypothetical protein E4T38_04423 [Aureobasidium subglaciale]|nr:hypothetical protein E4T38_04423 [Aureobasidium subglaciale]KAI5224118.1 hypothetical protein E4T40_04199 [Aureobasidium subglaciale]KAI5228405.1 hypothetical protein E4T41_03960 [Aureobasidium subglaciale]KAI5262945.1 hypothetical protein E4T46_04167 [Aureobasidium subglaciale]
MATRVRSDSPQVEPFPPLEVPHTPTLASHSAFAKDNHHLFKPRAPDYTAVSPKSPARFSPRPLTGAAAQADARRLQQQQQSHESSQTSANPAATALHALMSGPGMSKASDLASPNFSPSSQMRKPSTHLTVPVTTTAEASQPSPVSLRSFGDSDAVSPNGAMTTTAHEHARDTQMVAEPAEMTSMDYPEPTRGYNSASSAHPSHKSFTYPGPASVAAEAAAEGQSRASPSTKRHKRLHDLKRHTKLHTGERPHICDKCGRRFARGDALARHNKGPGGCAGRRSSFGGDDDSRMGDEGMDGMEYTDNGENGHDMDDEDDNPRRESEPSRKRAHIEDSHDPNRSIYRQHSSTYPPPLASRTHRGNMGPPNHHILPSSNAVTSPGEITNMNPTSNMALNPYGSTPTVVLGEGGISHSPKPLSPNQQDQHRLSIAEATSAMRNRSPSLTQIQQAHNARNGQATPPAPHQMSQHTQLPSLAGLASGHSMRLPIQSAAHNSMHNNMQSGPMHGSNPGSLSSHGHSSGGSMREIVGDGINDVWNYVRALEQRFSRMQDEYELRISRLQEDLIAIKGHLSFQQPR